MRLGAVFPQAEFRHLDPDELVAFVQRVEDAGYDHLLAFDHVLGADTRAARAGAGTTTTTTRSWSRSCCSRTSHGRAASSSSPMCSCSRNVRLRWWPSRWRPSPCSRPVASVSASASVGTTVEYEALGIDSAARAARIEEQIPSAPATLDRTER